MAAASATSRLLALRTSLQLAPLGGPTRLLSAFPRRTQLLSYNPPSISPVKVASLDPTLALLNLKDVRREELVEREQRLTARGKRIFVSG